jgi:spore maturation protein A
MILVACLVSFFTGSVGDTAQKAMSGAGDAVRMALSLAGAMALWTGIMKIAEASGLVSKISRLLSPAVRRLFPGVDPKSPAMRAMTLNMVANLLGLGNAATPLGLKAMEELDRANPEKGTATDAMCMFVVVNTASISLLPTTVLALRQGAGSAAPFSIVAPVWLVSALSLCVGVLAVKLMQKRPQRLRKVSRKYRRAG